VCPFYSTPFSIQPKTILSASSSPALGLVAPDLSHPSPQKNLPSPSVRPLEPPPHDLRRAILTFFHSPLVTVGFPKTPFHLRSLYFLFEPCPIFPSSCLPGKGCYQSSFIGTRPFLCLALPFMWWLFFPQFRLVVRHPCPPPLY